MPVLDISSGLVLVLAVLACPGAALAAAPDTAPPPQTSQTQGAGEPSADPDDKVRDLLDMSLEELLARQVTSVSKKARPVSEAAAAVTVITQEDIRRSSARTIPDLLRMVPGMEVAEVQSSATSVSARGFTSRFAANLLVMVDGAAIYSTSISGMFWDQALVPLQDIDRIEVIRGPGGPLWGSNSINGIVNIITKQSIDTQGVRFNASAGTFDARGEIGIGLKLRDSLSIRAYGAIRATRGLDGKNGKLSGNDWQGGLGGARLDYAPTTDDNVVVLGEISKGSFQERFIDVSLNPTVLPAIDIQNNHFHSVHTLARWKHRVSDNFDFTLQTYYNDLKRSEFGATIHRRLYDVSLEARILASSAHELNFGISGRISHDQLDNAFSLSLPTGHNTDRWLTGYVQDDIMFIPDRVRLTIGSKFETNNFTGTEIQPGARLFYRPNSKFSTWAAVSRAARTPLLAQREMIGNVTMLRTLPGFPAPVPVNSTYYGNINARSEQVTSYEWGFRGSFAQGWTIDAAAFYSDYRKMMSARLVGQSPIIVAPNPFPVGLQLDYLMTNEARAKSKGFEVLVTGMVAPWWKTEISYSFLDLKVTSAPNTFTLIGAGSSPANQIRLSSNMNVTDNLELDAFAHYVSKAKVGPRGDYTDLDIRATYRLSTQFDLSLVGSHLLSSRRLEYYNDILPIESVYVPRMAYVEARVRF